MLGRNSLLPRPVVLTLLLGVLLPTACVLWFMTQAVKNEQLAIRQRLIDLYQDQLLLLSDEWQSLWRRKISDSQKIVEAQAPAEAFTSILNLKLASSLVIDSGGDNTAGYPRSEKPLSQPRSDPQWNQATRLELRENNPAAAAEIYRAIAAGASDPDLAAQALNALARCLVKTGDTEAAIQILSHELAAEKYASTQDSQGRWIQLNALLRALQLRMQETPPAGSAAYDSMTAQVQLLSETLNSYAPRSEENMLSGQRIFLMRQLLALWPQPLAFPTLEAENLAMSFLSSDSDTAGTDLYTRLSQTPLEQVWGLSLPDHGTTLLFTRAKIDSDLRDLVLTRTALRETEIRIIPEQNETALGAALSSVALGGVTPGWRLALYVDNDELFSNAAQGRITAYLWTGALIVLSIFLLSALTAAYLNRQIKQNRLKNDLIATVSHELKTPLSSMRVLVDTLLDANEYDAKQSQEYLQLISKENIRLSRLIDNFLTFSRMERGKQNFAMHTIDATAMIHSALEAVKDKFEAAGFKLTTEIAENLPPIKADEDFLITALINLLDNAYKYSDKDKRIHLRAYANGDRLCIEVQDWGIGLSRRDSKKIFTRFYRVDQRLSRETEGCGLGLNIVDYVVTAHGGSIEVESELGRGSLFRLSLPAKNQRGQTRLKFN